MKVCENDPGLKSFCGSCSLHNGSRRKTSKLCMHVGCSDHVVLCLCAGCHPKHILLKRNGNKIA